MGKVLKEYVKALIIKEPWASLILNGVKVWEIRKYETNTRGYIGLVNKKQLKGFVELFKVKKMKIKDLEREKLMHRVNKSFLKKYAEGRKELYVWMLRNPIKLEKPIKINYPSGRKVWARVYRKDVEGKIPKKIFEKVFDP